MLNIIDRDIYLGLVSWIHLLADVHVGAKFTHLNQMYEVQQDLYFKQPFQARSNLVLSHDIARFMQHRCINATEPI